MAAPTGYNVNDILRKWAQTQAGGLPGEGLGVISYNVKLYSSKNIATGTNFNQNLRFFDETANDFVQNIVTQNALPSNFALMVHAVRFGFVPGFDRNGRRLGQASPSVANINASALSFGSTAAASGDLVATQWKWAEKIRELMSQPIVSFGLVAKDLWQVRGLTALPDGKSSLVQAGTSQASTSATALGVADVFQSISNGAPVQGNKWSFASPWPLLGQESFYLDVDWPQVVDFAETNLGPLNGQTGSDTIIAGTLTAELEGVLGQVAS